MVSIRVRRARSTPDWAWAAVAMFAIGAWTYLGYPLLIRLAARRRRRPPPELPDHDLPTMTVIVPAHDEEANLPAPKFRIDTASASSHGAALRAPSVMRVRYAPDTARQHSASGT